MTNRTIIRSAYVTLGGRIVNDTIQILLLRPNITYVRACISLMSNTADVLFHTLSCSQAIISCRVPNFPARDIMLFCSLSLYYVQSTLLLTLQGSYRSPSHLFLWTTWLLTVLQVWFCFVSSGVFSFTRKVTTMNVTIQNQLLTNSVDLVKLDET